MKSLLFALMTLAFLASPGQAQAPMPPHEFVAKAAISNMFGVEAGTMALQKSASPEIKKFAHLAVNDRTTAGTGLRQILAKRSGISAPEIPDSKHQDILRELGTLQGADFDRAYIKSQQQASEDAVALFSAYAEAGTDQELKTFAAKTLPVMQAQRDLLKAFPGN